MTEQACSIPGAACHRTASGSLCYYWEHAAPTIIRPFGKWLKDEYGGKRLDAITVGLDEVFTKITIQRVTVHFGWDIWTGFSIYADQPAGDELVQKIALRFGSLLQDEHWRQHFNDSNSSALKQKNGENDT